MINQLIHEAGYVFFKLFLIGQQTSYYVNIQLKNLVFDQDSALSLISLLNFYIVLLQFAVFFLALVIFMAFCK